jgi:hypothetical protein
MTALRHVIAGYARQAQLSIRPALKFDSHYTGHTGHCTSAAQRLEAFEALCGVR